MGLVVIDRTALGSIGTLLTKARLRHFATVFWFNPYRAAKSLSRSLYRSSDSVRGRGTAMKYLAHIASRNVGSAWLIPRTLWDQTRHYQKQ
jgi:hypothetical protein